MTFPRFPRQHWVAGVLAIAIALVYGGDHLLALRTIPWDVYEPTTIASDLDAAVTYYPRTKAAFNGDFLVGDINLAEYMESPAVMSIINPVVMGSFARLMGSMKAGVVVSDFLFPALIFLLAYALFVALLQRKVLALVAAALFIFGPTFPFIDLRTIAHPPIFSFPFSRIDNPKATMLWYLAAALATFVALRSPAVSLRFWRAWRMLVLAGVLAGALFYTDPYDWVTFWAGLGILLIWWSATRTWDRARVIGIIMAIGLIVSVGYWVNFMHLAALPQYADIITRIGVERSHAIRFAAWALYFRIGILIVSLAFLTRKRDRFAAGFVCAFLLPLFVTLNLQVLTGVVPQPDHWMRPLFPFAFAALALIAVGLREQFFSRVPMRAWMAGAVVSLVALFGIEAYYQVTRGDLGLAHALFRGAETERAHHWMPAAGAASYALVRENLDGTVVVGSIAPATNLDLQLYTDVRIYLPFGLNTVAPTEEIWRRFFALASLYGLTEEQQDALLRGEEMGLYLFQNAFYSDAHNSYFRGSARTIPEEFIAVKRAQYALDDPRAIPFRLDYIYFGPNERALGAHDPIEQLPTLRRAYSDEEVTMYVL